MLQIEVPYAIFHTRQTSGTCARVCACNGTHQIKKTGIGILWKWASI